MMRKHGLKFVVLFLTTLIPVACSPLSLPAAHRRQSGGGRAPAQELADSATGAMYTRVAFVYPGPINDQGWNRALEQGRLALHDQLSNVETAYQENVSLADAERTIRDFAQQGFQVIFTASMSYMAPTLDVAKDFPQTVFINIGGHKTAPNVGTAFGKIEEPQYVAGLIAGMMTRSNILGYVAPFPIPEVIRSINAFTLGVRKSNANASVRVVWTNSWSNARQERSAGATLIDGGADVLAQHQDSTVVQQVAQVHGKFGLGSNAAPRAVLTSAIWNWGVYYSDVVKQVQAGTWKSQAYWGGWKDRVVDLAPIGSTVPEDVKRMAEEERARFKAGKQTIFTIFGGPLENQDGVEKAPAGKSLSVVELQEMDWFVEGVEATLP